MLRIALVQMEIHDADVSRNLSTAEAMIRHEEADLYLLPELWTTGYAHDSWPSAADNVNEVVARLQAWSRSQKAWIGGTMVSRNSVHKLSNRFWLVGPEGQLHWYDKIHLFPPMSEDTHLTPGTRTETLTVGDFRTSLSICFDLRFPRMYLSQAATGTSLFLVSAEWPHPRTHIMRTLAAARAIECQAFVVLCNRVGPASDGSKFCGSSAIFCPDGTVVADAGDAAALAVGEIDIELVKEMRSNLPITRSLSPHVDFA